MGGLGIEHSSTPSLPHSSIPSLIHSLTPSLPHSLTPSLIHSLTPPLIHPPTHLLIHSNKNHGNYLHLHRRCLYWQDRRTPAGAGSKRNPVGCAADQS
ncbi:hypothetical protein E1H13_00285 [Nodosilinea sp. P-1105]|nr:hypothetical protein [Nodosilinea sp. P-1105]